MRFGCGSVGGGGRGRFQFQRSAVRIQSLATIYVERLLVNGSIEMTKKENEAGIGLYF